MHELAERGDVILVGRGGNRILRDDPRAFHVRLVAPMPVRVRRVMEYRWVQEGSRQETDCRERLAAQQLLRKLFRGRLVQSLGIRHDRQQRPAGADGRGTGRALAAERHWSRAELGLASALFAGKLFMELTWGIAAIWLGLALVASLLSIRFKMSVALVEILVGIAAGNLALLLDHYHVFGLHWELKPNEWIAFLAGFGSILLTFMAGRRSSRPCSANTSRRLSPSGWRALSGHSSAQRSTPGS